MPKKCSHVPLPHPFARVLDSTINWWGNEEHSTKFLFWKEVRTKKHYLNIGLILKKISKKWEQRKKEREQQHRQQPNTPVTQLAVRWRVQPIARGYTYRPRQWLIHEDKEDRISYKQGREQPSSEDLLGCMDHGFRINFSEPNITDCCCDSFTCNYTKALSASRSTTQRTDHWRDG